MREKWQDAPELHPLDGARAKATRAAQHTHHLLRHCEAFNNSAPIQLSARKAGTDYDVYVDGRWPPRYLGLILGEVIHDLRSALDHAACALAVDHAGLEAVSPPAVARVIQFPIASKPERFQNHQALRYFSQAAVDVMEPRQPYHNEGTGRVNPLAIIQNFNNQDKHRVLMPSLGQLRLGDIQIVATERIPEDRIEYLMETGTVLGSTLPFIRIHESAHIDLSFAPPPIHICFLTDVTGQPDVFFAEKIPGLCDAVGEVIEDMAQLFPEVDWSSRAGSWLTPELD
jgi:hypothetical protein